MFYLVQSHDGRPIDCMCQAKYRYSKKGDILQNDCVNCILQRTESPYLYNRSPGMITLVRYPSF